MQQWRWEGPSISGGVCPKRQWSPREPAWFLMLDHVHPWPDSGHNNEEFEVVETQIDTEDDTHNSRGRLWRSDEDLLIRVAKVIPQSIRTRVVNLDSDRKSTIHTVNNLIMSAIMTIDSEDGVCLLNLNAISLLTGWQFRQLLFFEKLDGNLWNRIKTSLAGEDTLFNNPSSPF